MLIDDFLPRWDVASHHELTIDAPASVVYRAVRELRLGRSPIVTLLFAARALPALFTGRARGARSLTLETLPDLGFVVLAEDPGRELVVGAIGRFWRPTGDLRPVAPDGFRSAEPEGFAKGVMNIAVTPRGDGTCLVSTQTRVRCIGRGARRAFRWYWRVVGPFSGAIRRATLQELKRSVETRA